MTLIYRDNLYIKIDSTIYQYINTLTCVFLMLYTYVNISFTNFEYF